MNSENKILLRVLEKFRNASRRFLSRRKMLGLNVWFAGLSCSLVAGKGTGELKLQR